MARRPQDVTEAELEVLRTLWDLGESTIRSLADRIYPDGGPSEYGTVQKLLERLEDKGHVSHRSEGRANAYSATLGREALVARRLRETADTLCDGSLTPLLTHLVHAGSLSGRELAELRRLVDDLSRKR